MLRFDYEFVFHSSSNCTQKTQTASLAGLLRSTSLARQGMEPLAKKSLRHACGHVGHENSLHLRCTLVSRHHDYIMTNPKRKINPVKHSLRQASGSAAHTITHAWPSRLNLANFSLIWRGQRAVPPKRDLRFSMHARKFSHVRVAYTWPLRALALAPFLPRHDGHRPPRTGLSSWGEQAPRARASTASTCPHHLSGHDGGLR
jgi:hypothetical protein